MRALVVAILAVIAVAGFASASPTYIQFDASLTGPSLMEIGITSGIWLTLLTGFGVIGYNLPRRRAATLAMLQRR